MSRRDSAGPVPLWGAFLLLLLAWVLAAFCIAFAALMFSLGHDVPWREALGPASKDMFNIGLSQAVGIGGAAWLGRLWFVENADPRVAFAFQPVSNRTLIFAFLAGIGLQFPLAELGNLLQALHPYFKIPIERQFEMQRMTSPENVKQAVATIFALVIVAPVAEEVFFRGFLFTGFRKAYGGAFTLLATALLFGMMHFYPPAACVYATVAGLVLGFVRLRTKSILPTLTMHAATNAVPLLLPQHVVSIRGFNQVSQDVQHVPVPFVVGGLVLAILSIAAIFHANKEPQDA